MPSLLGSIIQVNLNTMEKLNISIHARENKKDELLRTCQLIADQARMMNGCTSSRVSQDMDNKNSILFDQQWEQWSFLSDFFQSDHFTALMGAMKWLGRIYEIRINEGTPEDGKQAVQRVREM